MFRQKIYYLFNPITTPVDEPQLNSQTLREMLIMEQFRNEDTDFR